MDKTSLILISDDISVVQMNSFKESIQRAMPEIHVPESWLFFGNPPANDLPDSPIIAFIASDGHNPSFFKHTRQKLPEDACVVAGVNRFSNDLAVTLTRWGLSDVIPLQKISSSHLASRLLIAKERSIAQAGETSQGKPSGKDQKGVAVDSGAQNALESGHVVSLIDRLPFGVVFMSDSCKMLHANTEGQALLDTNPLIGVNQRGNFSIKDRTLSAQMKACIKTVLSPSGDNGASNPSLFVSSQDTPELNLTLQFTSVQNREGNQGIAMFLRPTHSRLKLSMNVLERLYGLSRAEGRLVCLLVDGLSIREIAEKIHVSQHTLRAQLKQVFLKTDCKRQGDLIKKILSGPAVVSDPAPRQDVTSGREAPA